MKRSLLFALGLVVVLAIAVAGCGGEEEGGASAAERIDAAWTKMNETKALHEEFDVQMEIDGDLSGLGEEMADLLPASMGISGTADVDQTDEENIKAAISLELDIADLMDKVVQSTLGTGEMTDEDAAAMQMFTGMFESMEIIMVDQMLYVELLGGWYEMDLAEVSDSSPVDVGVTGSEDAQCFQDKLTPSKMLQGIEEKGKEDVDGEETTHYVASIDTGATVDLIAEMSKECGEEEMSDTDITEAKDILEGMLTKGDIELWIDGDDQIRKMTLDMEMDMGALAETAGSMVDPEQAEILEGMVVTVTMSLQMSKFGEEVTVEAPEDAMPIEDLLGSLGGLGGGSDFGLDDGTDSGTGTTPESDDFDFGDEDIGVTTGG